MGRMVQGLLFWLFQAGFKVSLGTVYWYRSNYGTDFDISEIAGLLEQTPPPLAHRIFLSPQ